MDGPKALVGNDERWLHHQCSEKKEARAWLEVIAMPPTALKMKLMMMVVPGLYVGKRP